MGFHPRNFLFNTHYFIALCVTAACPAFSPPQQKMIVTLQQQLQTAMQAAAAKVRELKTQLAEALAGKEEEEAAEEETVEEEEEAVEEAEEGEEENAGQNEDGEDEVLKSAEIDSQ
jgi:hypothetical protein